MGLVNLLRNYAVDKGYYNPGDEDELDEDFTGRDSDGDDAFDDDEYADSRGKRAKISGRITPNEREKRPSNSREYAGVEREERRAATITDFSQVQMSVGVFQPTNINDTTKIIDRLSEGKIVFFNVEKLDSKDAQRIVDFLGGAVYTLHGELEQMGHKLYIAVPMGIPIEGRIAEEASKAAGTKVFSRFKSTFKS